MTPTEASVSTVPDPTFQLHRFHESSLEMCIFVGARRVERQRGGGRAASEGPALLGLGAGRQGTHITTANHRRKQHTT